MRIMTGVPVFFASSAGITQDDRAGRAAAEAAAGVRRDEDDVLRLEAAASAASEATVCTVLCVPVCMNSLPFSQYAIAVRGSSTWWLVVRRRERLVEHERGVLEPGLEIAVRPLVERLAHRQLALVVFGEIFLGPLQLHHVDRRRRRAASALRRGRRRRTAPVVALRRARSGCRAAGVTSGSTTNGSGSYSI